MSVPVRQPLPFMLVVVETTKEADALGRTSQLVLDEVNVKALIIAEKQSNTVKYYGEQGYVVEGLRQLLKDGALLGVSK